MKLDWYDVVSWGVEGKGWSDTIKPFDRLPRHAEGVVRDVVWNLSRHSAGLLTRFETDARSIDARWVLQSERLAQPHTPASAVSGVDLYALDSEGAWRWVASSKPQSFPTVEARLIEGLDGERRTYMMYLPLYNGVDSLEIGVPQGASFVGIPPRRERPVVYYGTSIVHGASASRPGMAHVAILGRRLGVPFLNLGFSGNGQMEPEIATLLAELDPRVYVIDCLPNMEGDLVRERAAPLVRTIHEARPTTPIVLVEDRTYPHAYWVQRLRARHEASRAALREAYEMARGEGVETLVYVPGETLLGADGDDTVDGSHPTDVGFVRMADRLEPVLRPLLGGNRE